MKKLALLPLLSSSEIFWVIPIHVSFVISLDMPGQFMFDYAIFSEHIRNFSAMGC